MNYPMKKVVELMNCHEPICGFDYVVPFFHSALTTRCLSCPFSHQMTFFPYSCWKINFCVTAYIIVWDTELIQFDILLPVFSLNTTGLDGVIGTN